MTSRGKLCLLVMAAALSLAALVAPASAQLPAGCAAPYDYAAFRRSSPHSILVLPPLNQSLAIEGPYSWLSTVSRPLAERGYYVFPVAVIDQLMKGNGLPTASEMHQVPLAKLREVTGADAVLYVVLHKYGSEFQVFETITTVEVSARLVDAQSGAVLWNGSGRARESSNDGKSFKEEFNLLGDLLDAVIGQIINSKTDPAHKLSRQANVQLFTTPQREIPAGPYLPVEQQKSVKGSKYCEKQRQKLEAARMASLGSLLSAAQASIVNDMIALPAGVFQMGDVSGGGMEQELPVHTVAVKAFKLGRREVTFDQYDAFAKATGRPLPGDGGWGRGDRPVIGVNWEDAKAFAAWISRETGGKYRLPTESEWEYAARGGSTSTYPWGEEFSADQANGPGTTGRDQWANSAHTGSFPANPFGLYDMIGNAAEWTEDCYNSSYAGAPADGSAWVSGDCALRMVRGGAFAGRPDRLRVSHRSWPSSTIRYNDVGFRLAQD